MTHLLDTSALLAHYLQEPGTALVQALFEDETKSTGTSVLVLYEFELRLHLLGMDASARVETMNLYRADFEEIIDVNETVRVEAFRLRTNASARISTVDTLIAATASLNGAILVHRDPHFSVIPKSHLKQEILPAK